VLGAALAIDGPDRLGVGGGTVVAAGAFLLFEDRMDHGKVTPLHVHPDSDETMVVLEGEILMHLDGAEHTVSAGGIASAPRGVPHAFKVSGLDGARLLCLHTPGCCQTFYWDASEAVGPRGERNNQGCTIGDTHAFEGLCHHTELTTFRSSTRLQPSTRSRRLGAPRHPTGDTVSPSGG